MSIDLGLLNLPQSLFCLAHVLLIHTLCMYCTFCAVCASIHKSGKTAFNYLISYNHFLENPGFKKKNKVFLAFYVAGFPTPSVFNPYCFLLLFYFDKLFC